MMATTVIAVLTIVLTSTVADQRATGLADFPAFTVLLVAAAASAGLRFGQGGGQRVSFSFTAVLLLAAIPLVGPVGAVLLGVGAAILDARQGWWQAWVLNGAMFGLSAAVASVVYTFSGGAFLYGRTPLPVGPPSPAHGVWDLVLGVGLPLMLADIAFLSTNLAVLLIATRKDPKSPSRASITAGALRTVPSFLAWGLVAFVIVVLWGPGQLEILALLLVIAPLVVTRRIHELFSAERRVRANIMNALARAGRDDGMEAHGERVVRYATSVATELGLRPSERSELHYSARLHGVGMAERCDWRIRVGDGRADAERAALAASDVVNHIDFLHAVSDAVRHEAEWFDGTGGPHGLSGSDIPILARILAVADAADVLVTRSQADHPEVEAVRELRLRAGSRFDPDVVEALVRALRISEGPSPVGERPAPVQGRGRPSNGRGDEAPDAGEGP